MELGPRKGGTRKVAGLRLMKEGGWMLLLFVRSVDCVSGPGQD